MKNEIPKAKNKKIRGATKEVYDGITFDSKLECECYRQLKAYGIRFRLKPIYVLQEKFSYLLEHVRAIEMEPDFYLEDLDIILDTKGHQTKDNILKVKMLKNYLRINNLSSSILMIKNKKELYDFIYKLKYNLPL